MAEYTCSVTSHDCRVKMKIPKEIRDATRASGGGRKPLWFSTTRHRLPYCACHDVLALKKGTKTLSQVVMEGREQAGLGSENPPMPVFPPPLPDPYA